MSRGIGKNKYSKVVNGWGVGKILDDLDIS